MGSWGVNVRESDWGLDLLALAKKKCLKPNDYKRFSVRGIMSFLKNHIISGIVNESAPHFEKADDDIEYWINANFPERYSYVVWLVSDCLVEYAKNGEFLIYESVYDDEIDEYKEVIKPITKFIYADSDLDDLLTGLKEMMLPNSEMYTSWIDDETRNEWLAHMQMLCEGLEWLRGRSSVEHGNLWGGGGGGEHE